MGESFLGIPNRFRNIGRQSGGDLAEMLEGAKTYNPNHILSAYYGYRLATEYVNRNGGTKYAMTGSFITQSIEPSTTGTYNIGSSAKKYTNMWADTFNGNSTSTSKLKNPVTIKLNGAVKGSVSFDGSTDVDIVTERGLNWDERYLKLTGGTLTGNLNSTNIVPTLNNAYTIGTSSSKYSSIYAGTFHGALDGNASTATKLLSKRQITVSLQASTNALQNSGSEYFDGSGNITIKVSAPYVPISGNSTINGTLGVTGDLTTSGNFYLNGGIRCNRAAGSYVSLYRNGNSTNKPASSNGIDAYIDDLACNCLVASAVLNGGSNTETYTMKVYANDVYFYGLECAYYDENNRIAYYKTTDMGYARLHTDDIYMQKNSYLYTRNIWTYDDTNQGPIYTNGKFVFQGYGKNSAGTSGSEDWWNNVLIDPGTKQHSGKITVNGSAVHGSDIRIKSNIDVIPREVSTNIISKLVPTSYDLSVNDRHRGLIAQQVKTVMKEYSCDNQVCDIIEPIEKGGADIHQMTVDYIGLIPDLINTCQYLISKVDTLEVKCGIKKNLEFSHLLDENTFEEAYYRKHAEEIATM